MTWFNAQWKMDVDVANVTAAYAGINLAGPHARTAIEKLASDIDFSAAAFPYMAARVGQLAGIPVRILRVGFVGELGYEIHCPVRPRRSAVGPADGGRQNVRPRAVRRRGAAHPAAGEGPHHRRPGHRRPDAPGRSQHGMGARQEEAVLRRQARRRHADGEGHQAQARRLCTPRCGRADAQGVPPRHPQRRHRRTRHVRHALADAEQGRRARLPAARSRRARQAASRSASTAARWCEPRRWRRRSTIPKTSARKCDEEMRA